MTVKQLKRRVLKSADSLQIEVQRRVYLESKKYTEICIKHRDEDCQCTRCCYQRELSRYDVSRYFCEENYDKRELNSCNSHFGTILWALREDLKVTKIIPEKNLEPFIV